MLGDLSEKKALDLFSGTGALGFEALSGSAAHVTFVECDKSQCRKIKENLTTFGLLPKATILPLDASAAIRKLSEGGERFSLIFLDPPYEKGLAEKTLQTLSESQILKDGSIVIVESNKRESLPETFGVLKKIKTKLYGDTCILVYKVGF